MWSMRIYLAVLLIYGVQVAYPLCEGDSPQCGEMSHSDRGARPRKRSRKAGAGEI